MTDAETIRDALTYPEVMRFHKALAALDRIEAQGNTLLWRCVKCGEVAAREGDRIEADHSADSGKLGKYDETARKVINYHTQGCTLEEDERAIAAILRESFPEDGEGDVCHGALPGFAAQGGGTHDHRTVN